MPNAGRPRSSRRRLSFVVSAMRLERVEAGVLRRAAGAHPLHDEVPAGDEDVGLASPGAPGRAHRVVHEAPRADERRVAHPAGHLEEEAAGAGAAGEVAAAVARREVHRAVAARVTEGVAAVVPDELLHRGVELRRVRLEPLVLRREVLLPVEPHLPRLVGEEVLHREAVHLREAARARADQEDVVGGLHDRPGDLARVLDALERRHRARPRRRPVHDAGVELHHSFLVGDAAVADAHVVRVVLDQVHPGDDRVQRVHALLHPRQRQLRRLQPVRRADDDRPGAGRATSGSGGDPWAEAANGASAAEERKRRRETTGSSPTASGGRCGSA